MNVLITGAAGFIGKNLTAALEAVRDGKDHRFPELKIETICLADVNTGHSVLENGCRNADFVFHLAGVNRPEDPEEYMRGNRDFTAEVLGLLQKHRNTCPVVLASSIQATLAGRYNGEYGRSKKAAEDLCFAHSAETGAKVMVYRFPNLFGKWCRPNYNSVVATFCHNYAHDLPVSVDDPAVRLELLYIDDLMDEMFAALLGREHHCSFDGIRAVPAPEGVYCMAPVTHYITLGEILGLLDAFQAQPKTLYVPQIAEGSFEKKLYSTYLSYLPKEKIAFPLQMHTDVRGSFTELLRTASGGQFSVNVSKPGAVKGQHWHHTKWEFFIVISGRGVIQMRKIGTDEVLDFPVSGEKIEAVHMLPGYTHNIINLSETEDLITIMWTNECFDPNRPDTFFEAVK